MILSSSEKANNIKPAPLSHAQMLILTCVNAVRVNELE